MSRDISILRFDGFNVEKSTYAPNLWLAPHKDANSRISIILKGQLEEKTDTAHVYANVGSLVIKPNHVVHENIFGTSPSTLLSVSFDNDFVLPPLLQSWKWLEHPKVAFWGTKLWLQLQHVKNDRELNKVFTDFITTINSLGQIKKNSANAWLNDTKQAICNNLRKAETMQLLSQRYSVHRVHLARAFKKQFGTSPLEYRKYARLSSIIPELMLTDKSLTEIAFDAGFADQSHMNRTLQQALGCTPGEVRKFLNDFKVSNVQDRNG